MVLTGLLLGLAFPPMATFFFAFFAFIPLLLVINSFVEKNDTRGFFISVYLTFFIYHGMTNWWISSWRENTDPFLLASGLAIWIFHPIFFMLPVYIYLKVRQNFDKYTSILLFPFVWVAYEWFFSLGEFSYPWLAVGNTQIYNHYWIQIVDITGLWGASFLITLTNSLILYIIFKVNDYYKNSIKFPKNAIILTVLLVLLIQIIPNVYGVFRLKDFEHDKLMANNEKLRISIVQPNIDPWGKWGRDKYRQIYLHKFLQDSISSQVPNIDLSIWSETTLMRYGIQFNTDLDFYLIDKWADSNNTSILTGFVHDRVYKENEVPQVSSRVFLYDTTKRVESFNSALLYNPIGDDDEKQIYHKSKLTPFAERIPRIEYYAFLMDWISWGVGISSWGLGDGPHTLLFKNNEKEVKLGSIICIESIYPDFCRQFTLQGAEILSIITNDAWYDYTTGPEQHFQIACMRAIENRRYIARCANSGVSGFISPQGKEILRAEQYSEVAIYNDIPQMKELSFYVKNGDLIAELSALISLALIIYIISRKFYK